MTAIAFRNGVLAADSGVFTGDTCTDFVNKIFRSPCSWYTASQGSAFGAADLADWMADGGPEKGKKFQTEAGDDFAAILVSPAGEAWWLDGQGRRIRQNSDFVALGRSMEFLSGAMFAGAEAVEAVDLAIANTSFAAGDVNAVAVTARGENILQSSGWKPAGAGFWTRGGRAGP